MDKIYARKYQKMIDKDGKTLEEAKTLASSEVPERWREAVISLLHD